MTNLGLVNLRRRLRETQKKYRWLGLVDPKTAKTNLLCNGSSMLRSLASPTCNLCLGIGLQDLVCKEGEYGGLVWDGLRASKLVNSLSKAFTNSPHVPSLNFYTLTFDSRRAWNSLTRVSP